MASFKERLFAALPPALRQGAVDFKNALWGGYRHTYYSQFGEDIVLSQLLRSPLGFYVDVGANHPTRYSNTYLLYKRGWYGINFDPNKDAISAFKRERPRDSSVALGISKEEGTALLYRYADPAFNTLSRASAKELEKKTWLSPLPSIEVPVMPLRSALAHYLPQGTTIDVLTVDVEGLDLEVLESNDWKMYAPRVVAVEDHGFDAHEPTKSRIFSFLRDKGYTLKAHTGPTLIFVRAL